MVVKVVDINGKIKNLVCPICTADYLFYSVYTEHSDPQQVTLSCDHCGYTVNIKRSVLLDRYKAFGRGESS